jgi:myo-inositol 2-dehydrogenase/D-chiro-inositol 1-dehydrogenase
MRAELGVPRTDLVAPDVVHAERSPVDRRAGSMGIAVCGLGNIGSVHAESLASLRGCHISGVYDIDRDVTRRCADARNVRPYSTFDQLLADRDVRAVVLATPAEFHRDGVLAALEAGKHVFVEKPLTVSMSDARVIASAVQQSPLIVQVGFCERFNPQFIEARRCVSKLGRIQSVHTSRIGPLEFSDPAWELGALDTAVHNFDLILWLTGQRPVAVTAFAAHVYSEIKIPTAVTTVIRFEGGMIANDQINWVRTAAHPVSQCALARMTLFGDAGVFDVDLASRPSSLLTAHEFSRPDTISLGGPEYFGSLKLQFDAFVRAIESGGPSPVPVSDAVRVESLAIAAQESLRTGQTVSLPEELCAL